MYENIYEQIVKYAWKNVKYAKKNYEKKSNKLSNTHKIE